MGAAGEHHQGEGGGVEWNPKARRTISRTRWFSPRRRAFEGRVGWRGIGALGIIGIEGDPADRMYYGVLAIGISGAIVARFQPDGIMRAMFVTAAATILVGVIDLMLGKHQTEYSSLLEILGLTSDPAAFRRTP